MFSDKQNHMQLSLLLIAHLIAILLVNGSIYVNANMQKHFTLVASQHSD